MKFILQTLNKYKYVIIAFLFYTILAYIIKNSIINSVANSLMILLILNSISKLKDYNFATKILAYALTFFISILFSADIFFRYEFNSPIPFTVFSSILETTLGESLSVMTDYLATCLIILLITFTINCLTIKALTICKLNGWFSIIAFFPVYVIFILFAFMRNGDRESIADNIKQQTFVAFHSYLGDAFPLVIPEFVSTVVYYGEMSQLKNYANSPKTLPEGYEINTQYETKPTKVYLIIGESSTRDHYSLYGYHNPTTPFLDSLSQSTDSVLTHYNAISPAALTRDALRFTLSFAKPTDRLKPFYENKTLINLAKDVNYETIWLSNQENKGIFDGYIDRIVQQTNKSMFLDKTIDNPNYDDWNLLHLLPKFVIPKKEQFVILHLQGSHENYNDRYTAEDTVIVDNNKLIEAYDRTVHHTDVFLSQLYNFVKEQGDDAIIYYMSDHGENTDKVPFGHGQLTGTGQYRIPLIVIKYKSEINPSKIINKYVMKDLSLVNSFATISILAEIIGYNVTDSVVNKVVEDSQFIYHTNSSIIQAKDVAH